MKKAQETLRKHFDVDNSVDENAIIKAMKEYAFKVAKESLKNASIRAFMRTFDSDNNVNDYCSYYAIKNGERTTSIVVNTESILSLDNIPEL